MQKAASTSLAAALALFAASCGPENPITPNGTVLVEWDSSQASRETFKKATIGARTSKDYVATVSPKGAPRFKIAVHVETAPVDFTEGGKPVHQEAPVTIKLSVKENDGWELSAKCDDGPNYKMGSINEDGSMNTPLGMRQDCHISEHRRAGVVFKSSWKIGFTIIAKGEGGIEAFPSDEVTIE